MSNTIQPEAPKGPLSCLDFIMDYESGNCTEEEIVAGFQRLIDTGIAWQLQGHYGRAASYFIENGTCTPRK